MKAGDCSPALPCMPCTSYQGLKPGMYRSVLTDHGSMVIINCYVPNAGGSKKDGGGRPRAQAKMRFLFLLQKKVDELLQAGRQVCMSCGIIPNTSTSALALSACWSMLSAAADLCCQAA